MQQSTAGSLFFTPMLVHRTTVDESCKVEANDFLRQYGSESPPQWGSNSIGSFQDPNHNVLPHCPAISSALMPLINWACEELRLERQSIHICDSWINKYEQGHSQETHAHVPFSMSGIYYISVPEPSSILFYNPSRLGIVHPMPYDRGVVSLNVVEGMFLLFPSYLEHSVPVYKHLEPKISLAFNLLYRPLAPGVPC